LLCNANRSFLIVVVVVVIIIIIIIIGGDDDDDDDNNEQEQQYNTTAVFTLVQERVLLFVSESMTLAVWLLRTQRMYLSFLPVGSSNWVVFSTFENQVSLAWGLVKQKKGNRHSCTVWLH
jgi:hypothetical protein